MIPAGSRVESDSWIALSAIRGSHGRRLCLGWAVGLLFVRVLLIAAVAVTLWHALRATKGLVESSLWAATVVVAASPAAASVQSCSLFCFSR